MKLQRSYFINDNVVEIAKDLIGKILFTNFHGKITAGIIIETEAYAGIDDKASHAWGGRHTARTDILYRQGGIAYVYLCYGMHHLFNIVTNKTDIPHAVLIRGIKAIYGIDIIQQRMGTKSYNKGFITGPGKVSKALGIKVAHTGMDLTGDTIWVENSGKQIKPEDILITTRVGIDYAGSDALLPYRYILRSGSAP
jgi:DNA-3-methyladenine glycosylase